MNKDNFQTQTESDTSFKGGIRWRQRHRVSPRYYFALHRGGALRDVYDLYQALETMTEDQFRHHVGPDHNDFAIWLDQVIGEDQVAVELRQMQSRSEIRSCLEKCLYF